MKQSLSIFTILSLLTIQSAYSSFERHTRSAFSSPKARTTIDLRVSKNEESIGSLQLDVADLQDALAEEALRIDRLESQVATMAASLLIIAKRVSGTPESRI